MTWSYVRIAQIIYIPLRRRGNDYTLEQKRIYKPECKNFFSNKIVTTWNTLPNIVVKSESLNVFKNIDLISCGKIKSY